jgi:hypothetical protein
MKEIKKYVCETCHSEFEHYSEASMCERNHACKENISLSSFKYKANQRLPEVVILKINGSWYYK